VFAFQLFCQKGAKNSEAKKRRFLAKELAGSGLQALIDGRANGALFTPGF